MSVSQRAYVALGSNLSDPVAQVTRALHALGQVPRSRIRAQSSLYRTAPVGYADQPDFINAVAVLDTALAPRDLLQSLLDIEQAFGRERLFRNGPRILDLDLLLYGELILHEAGLTLPHPRMHERAFVLMPLVEIAPDCHIPGQGAAADWAARVGAQGIARVA